MSPLPLILASASPRRQQLLDQLGVSFTVQQQDIDESRRPGETPADYVQRMAREKAGAARRAQSQQDCLLIGADTIVVLDDVVMGKPRDELDARRMLLQLSAREHAVMSAVTVCSQAESKTALSVSRVQFRAITASEAACYWATGEPAGKAGGYAIQGLAAVFIKHLAGSYSGVMGLPLFETAELLGAFGVSCLSIQAEQQ